MGAQEPDKYPARSGRRRFVRGLVGSSALAGATTAAGASVNATTNPTGVGGGTTEYIGIENIAGPAPRPMPQIPVRIDDEGYLQGLWPEVEEIEEDGRTVSEARVELPGPGGEPIVYSSTWFQYCGVQTYPGVVPDADQDQYFRYADADYYAWQRDAVQSGDRLHVADFADHGTWANDVGGEGLGKPALATWRSAGVPKTERLPVQVIRSPLLEGVDADPWLEAATRDGFIAFLDKCTHFCCVPGFKAFRDSEDFAGGGDMVYCQCHQSVYDPFSVVRRSFVALPRPE